MIAQPIIVNNGVSRTIRIDVRGTPRPQGSLKNWALPNGKIASTYGDRVWEWRRMVQSAVTEAMAVVDGNPQITGAIELRLGFDLPRPAGHFGTGRNAGQVKPSAPAHPTVAPDLDKLVRCVDDAITDSGFWHDDAQVVFIQAAKRYVTTAPGVLITITELA